MCYISCLFNSLTSNKFLKYSFILNIMQIIINSLIIIFTLLCFISCNLDLIIKTGYTFYINNIFFCVIILLITILIIFYSKKEYLIKEKKQSSIFLIIICLSISAIKFFTSLFTFLKNKRLYKLINTWKYTYQSGYLKIYKDYNILFTYLLVILVLFFINGILWLLYAILISHLRIIIINNNANNNYYNSNNLSHLSTKSDFDDNNSEIIINNLNEGSKNNNFYYLSENIINNIKKEFEDKESQTIIKSKINTK